MTEQIKPQRSRKADYSNYEIKVLVNKVILLENTFLCKITTFNCCFLCSVILHKLTHQHLPMCTALDWCDLET